MINVTQALIWFWSKSILNQRQGTIVFTLKWTNDELLFLAKCLSIIVLYKLFSNFETYNVFCTQSPVTLDVINHPIPPRIFKVYH